MEYELEVSPGEAEKKERAILKTNATIVRHTRVMDMAAVMAAYEELFGKPVYSYISNDEKPQRAG